ncbi:hypothetical protein GASC598I20_009170 [Gilliamella apicola SCGC AB-598-I20]|nr:hypothetical protein GASC598I20_009170 [Gilliamella apicola SCGC AB-598-I20]
MYHWMLAQYIQYERMELIVNGDTQTLIWNLTAKPLLELVHLIK